VSTRRVEKLAEQLGVKQLSKSQVSEMATHLDAQVEAFRNRPLDAAHYTFVWLDALVIKGSRARADGECARSGCGRRERRRWPGGVGSGGRQR